MIVKNTASRVIIVPIDPSGTQLHRLLMGWSPVSDEVWAKALPHVGALLEEGTLEVLGTIDDKGPDGKGKVVTRAKTLRDLTPKEATKLLKECYDVKALQAWLDGSVEQEQESRESVRVVLQNRIKEMTDRSPSDAAAEDVKAAKNLGR